MQQFTKFSFFSLLIVLCFTPAVQSQESAQVLPSSTIEFPEMEDSYLDHVLRYEINDISRLGLGLHKDQIRYVLGNPHFSEGIFFVRHWNYIMDVQIPDSAEYQRCQLQLVFDRYDFVQGIYWKQPECEVFLPIPPEMLFPESLFHVSETVN